MSLGRANPFWVVASTIVSATAGASVLYWIARYLGGRIVDRFGRFIRLDAERLERVEHWFERYGAPVIIVGRLIPGLRIAVAVASGVVHVPFWKFVLYTSISATIWACVYMGIGWALGAQYQTVSEAVHRITGDPILVSGVVAVVAVLVALVVFWRLGAGGRGKTAPRLNPSSSPGSNSIM